MNSTTSPHLTRIQTPTPNMAIPHITILVLLFLSLALPSFSVKCHPNDKKALLQFKKGLNNPYDIIIWDPKTDCYSEWYGVKCDQKTNRVIQLSFSNSDLKLPIPATVDDHPYLQSLALYYTSITGQIPQAISKLSNLKFLDLCL
ncbi:hypothetical protein ACS0TY_034600 [Phlomoides rotata]